MTPSLATIYSGELEGIEAKIVEVEVDLQVGLHSFSIVGLADKAVSEARERVSGALKNSGAKPPNRENRKITVNLAPANIHKTGAQYDLAIAIGYLLATKQMQSFDTKNILFAGELSLSGQLRRIRGALNMAIVAGRMGFETIVVPRENANEIKLIRTMRIIAAETLKEVIGIMEKREMPRPLPHMTENVGESIDTLHSFSEIKGQQQAKRALTIATAGHHNILMSGPPGVGKSALANALPSILPKLSESESIEATQIYSASGFFPESLVETPPFRAPHHTTSLPAIIGGGVILKPGEITLAHHGVLFLDEFPEFRREVLESLREPMESGTLQLSRLRSHLTLPASFIMVAAMNPCPCGYYGDKEKECKCTARDILRYKKKISGPLLDRVDLQINIQRTSTELLGVPSETSRGKSEDELLREKVANARNYAKERLGTTDSKGNNRQNGLLSSQEITKTASLAGDAVKFLGSLQNQHISPRSYFRLLKTARTVADLEQSEQVSEAHLAEAFGYRFKE